MSWAAGFILLAGLVLLAHFFVGWRALLAPWGRIDPGSVGVASSLVLASYALRTVRIHDYFRSSTAGKFPRTFRLVLIHNILNNLMPMRSGEASFPILMSREFQVPYARSIPALFFLRILDLHFVLLLGLAVLIRDRGLVSFLGVLLLAPLPYLIYRAQEILKPRLEESGGVWGARFRKALEGLPTSSGLFWRTWAWTAVNWSVKLTVLAWILRVFTPMPFASALVGSTTGELSSVLPFHGIAGAGTYEAGVLASLLPLGVAPEAALSAAVNLHLFVLGISILAGGLALLLPAGRTPAGGSADDSS